MKLVSKETYFLSKIYYSMDSLERMWKKVQQNQYLWIVIILGLYMVGYWIYAVVTRFETDIIVDREIVQGGRKVVNNLIASQDGRVFQVQNNAMVFFFRSAEVLATLQDGRKYRIKGYGKRVPSLGMYPQITGVLKSYS